MCESFDNIPIIRVREKTNKAKYEFLRLYYTTWNMITKTRPRVIIDTHAGSGIAELHRQKDILNKKSVKRIYGSPLIAILKTLQISSNLTIILNEANKTRFHELEKILNRFKQDGIPIFKRRKEDFYYKSLKTKRKRKLKQKNLYLYPESPEERPPLGYVKNLKFTKANIQLYYKKIESVIDEIFQNYLTPVEVNNKIFNPIALFLVDPCGMVEWNEIIKKICMRSQKKEGTELILNWSWEAINRNLNTENKNSILSKIYGIPLKDVEIEFKNIIHMEQFLEKYIDQLKQYFLHVNKVGVPKDRKLKPRQSTYRKYFLLYCTNNKSGLSLAGYKTEKIKRQLRDNFEELTTYIYGKNN